MCGLSRYLEPKKIYRVIIIKEEFGHMVFVDFTGKKGAFLNMKKNLKKTGAEIITEMSGNRDEIKEKVLSLNKEAGLPGVMHAPKVA